MPNPLRVALFHRDNWYRQAPRLDGQFAYPVSQFTWEHFNVTKLFKIDLHDFKGYDILWMDEGKYKSTSRFIPNVPHYTYQVPLVVCYSLYPTLSQGHFERRIQRSQLNADLTLLDHDDLGRWQERLETPVRRLAYSVNERYYCDRGYNRDIDVGFYYVTGFNKERPALDSWLTDFCKRKGYTYHTTGGVNVGVEYAELLARTKVVVHMNRTPNTRPPRIFDVSASGACLLSNPMPRVSGEYWERAFQYSGFDSPVSLEYCEFEPSDIPNYSDDDCENLIDRLERLIELDEWEGYSLYAHQYVLACHTWQQRAKELYTILLELFPKLREGREKWMFSG